MNIKKKIALYRKWYHKWAEAEVDHQVSIIFAQASQQVLSFLLFFFVFKMCMWIENVI